MFDESKRAAIIEMRKQGHGIRCIARLLCASRNTVRHVINAGTPKVPRILRQNKAEPYRAMILKLLTRCRGNLVRVHEQLVAQGAQFSYPALTAFVRRNLLTNANSARLRSVNAAQEWLTQIIHGARPLEILQAELDDSSELASLFYTVKNGRHRDRKKAATVLLRKRGTPNTIVAETLHSSRVTTRRYFKSFSAAGPSALFGSTTRCSATHTDDSEKTRRILELLHQKPNSFGINRTSWTQRTLIQAYKESYDGTISRGSITRLLKNAGYSWRKARRVLTSPDPDYKDKVDLLLKTIRSLSGGEMLFFLDEWGPVQVRRRGGRAYRDKDNIPQIPRHQKSRGTVSLVAALSATTNQITWTYVTSKDTHAMTRLLEVLFNQYFDNSKLYVTWDAVAWHNSGALTDWLDHFNDRTKAEAAGPIIELVPLPTSAQFLNVIEGVFSGMTRAVVDNSDYNSPNDMKRAISQHFRDRNEYFKKNPRRAGKKIWEVDPLSEFNVLTASGDKTWQPPRIHS